MDDTVTKQAARQHGEHGDHTRPGTRRPLGRPPASSGEETRRRILDGARHCFAQHGYAQTTNRDIAATSGLTSAAIYHYFDSKEDLYNEVHDRVQEVVYERFERAIRNCTTLLE